ncbi:MAG: iron ABC transporter permease [Elusimicrobia bacterium]|nr:iron ABC transporter permease [Elusimicrobiota bacterium]
MTRPRSFWKRGGGVGWLLLIGSAAFLVALKMGSVSIGWRELFTILWQSLQGRLDSTSGRAAEIFIFIRLPRVLMAATVGALLASVGAALQALFRNPLADPYLLGISGGAALGSVIGLLLGAASPAPYACFGAALTLLVVLMLSRIQGSPNVSLMVLAGVAIHSFTASLLTFIISQARSHESASILFWLLGSLTALPYQTLIPLMVLSLVGLGALFLFGPALNLLAHGEETALTLGLNAERAKWGLVLLCALLTGLAVTFNGIIPFVGLVMPHIARLLFGSDHRAVLPLSAFLGAVLAVLADAVGRTLLAPQEIPVGVVTAMIGAPFFIYILRRERRKLL